MTWQAYASTRPRFLWIAALSTIRPFRLRVADVDWPG